MNRLLMIALGTLIASLAGAQDFPNPDPAPPCDWSWFYGSPEGTSTQPSHDEVRAGWACHQDQSVVDYIWRELDFEVWTTGMNHGFHEPCNPTFPIGRALTASMLMGYSGSSNPPTCDVKRDNMLDWALCWAGSRYEELSTHCATTSDAFATTEVSPLGSRTWLWPQGLYDQTVEGLSGTIIHEARHWDCMHNAGSDCGRGRSCDERWTDGCPWPSDGAGANRYQITWLAWYTNSGTRGGTGLKDAAVTRANEILLASFTHVPCFTLALDGTPMDVKDARCQ